MSVLWLSESGNMSSKLAFPAEPTDIRQHDRGTFRLALNHSAVIMVELRGDVPCPTPKRLNTS